MYRNGIILSEELHNHPRASDTTVAVIMGSRSDWETVKPCCDVLEEFKIPFEYGVVSAHRTPQRMVKYATHAQVRGLKIIIACAGGSAHLSGMIASETRLPVLSFGPTSKTFGSMDVIGSCVRMPSGVPLGFMGLDKAGAENAAYEAIRILALLDEKIATRYSEFLLNQTKNVPYSAHD